MGKSMVRRSSGFLSFLCHLDWVMGNLRVYRGQSEPRFRSSSLSADLRVRCFWQAAIYYLSRSLQQDETIFTSQKKSLLLHTVRLVTS